MYGRYFNEDDIELFKVALCEEKWLIIYNYSYFDHSCYNNPMTRLVIKIIKKKSDGEVRLYKEEPINSYQIVISVEKKLEGNYTIFI